MFETEVTPTTRIETPAPAITALVSVMFGASTGVVLNRLISSLLFEFGVREFQLLIDTQDTPIGRNEQLSQLRV